METTPTGVAERMDPVSEESWTLMKGLKKRTRTSPTSIKDTKKRQTTIKNYWLNSPVPGIHMRYPTDAAPVMRIPGRLQHAISATIRRPGATGSNTSMSPCPCDFNRQMEHRQRHREQQQQQQQQQPHTKKETTTTRPGVPREIAATAITIATALSHK
ncbi:hypothetical protein G5I_10559 [Acromyrmex echinatior]|uniref:Uncharacterized protein n=1 Tax=Acromyrmex echinatior TaxID=103372 RepID=F4WX82_ACREC|nr:hypothetical protein G5I_10559 [Acromyrmex echinatior]